MADDAVLQTVSVMLTFMIPMILDPEIMRKCQKELDKAIGRNYLPFLDDRVKLPYVFGVASWCW